MTESLSIFRSEHNAGIDDAMGVAVQGNKLQILTVLVKRLQDGSPVDTGEFRSGWHVTSGRPSGEDRRVGADPVGAVLRDLTDPKAWRDVVYVQNHVEHGEVLEYGLFVPPNPGPSKDPRTGRLGRVLVANGYSTQAPNGILGDAIAAVAQQFGLQQVA